VTASVATWIHAVSPLVQQRASYKRGTARSIECVLHLIHMLLDRVTLFGDGKRQCREHNRVIVIFSTPT
jgi:hypothetical protein